MNENDFQAAKNLRAIWDKKRVDLGINQEIAAKDLGITRSAFGQYLNGRIRIGTDFLLRVSRFLNVSPSEIRPEFENALEVKRDSPNPEIERLLFGFSKLTNEQKKVILRALNAESDSVGSSDSR